jgi:CRP-like cAMP-binding protein
VQRQARADQLARVSLFTRCSKRELRRLARESHVEQVDAGQALVTAGSPARQLYVILGGEAVVRRAGRTIGRLGVGEVVGELGLLSGAPRNADVVADGPLEVLGLDRDGLRRALDEVPGLSWKLLVTVAERLQPGQAGS